MAETRTNYLLRLGEIYRKVKAARRYLRAGGLTTKDTKDNDSGVAVLDIGPIAAQARLYSKQMQCINDAQLELEGLRFEAESLLPLHFVSGTHPEP